jgi:hypothetical protein
MEEIVQDKSSTSSNGTDSTLPIHGQISQRRIKIIKDLLANGLIHLDSIPAEKENR